jgi:hypothetical protein
MSPIKSLQDIWPEHSKSSSPMPGKLQEKCVPGVAYKVLVVGTE